LTTLRSLKNDPSKHGIKAIVGIGVFSLIPMNTDDKRVSPFNVKEAIHMNFFSERETNQLLEDYGNDCGVEVTKEVATTIYEYTSGYPGLWCL